MSKNNRRKKTITHPDTNLIHSREGNFHPFRDLTMSHQFNVEHLSSTDLADIFIDWKSEEAQEETITPKFRSTNREKYSDSRIAVMKKKKKKEGG